MGPAPHGLRLPGRHDRPLPAAGARPLVWRRHLRRHATSQSTPQMTPVPTAATPLRILQMNSLLNGGGTDDRAVRLIAGFHARGHRVAIAGLPDRKYGRIAREWGVPMVPAGPGKAAYILGSARELRRGKYQILQAHHGRDYWPAVVAGILSGVRPSLVLVRHLAKSPSSFVSRRFLLNRCEAMVAVSEFVAEVLKKGSYEPDSP
ncbi:MAG TPA: hypothetical protein DCY13_14640, partial [Verrucomicrobiales bacterium]|nr:hypothetical protein [Verrucomicrobiales bacterium]